MKISPEFAGREGDCSGAVKRLMSVGGDIEGTARMSLLLFALLQAALPPAPEYTLSVQPDGTVGVVIETLPEAKLAETEIELDVAAEKYCADKKAVRGELNYDQAIDSNGNTSPTITNLRVTFRCEAGAPKP
jgi:hypothetical protein